LAQDLVALSAALAVAIGTTLLIYLPVVGGFSVENQQSVIRKMVGDYMGERSVAARLTEMSSISKPLAHFLGGIAFVQAQNASGGVDFLNGAFSTHGFASYFFQAFLLKTAPALLVLTAVAILLGFRAWTGRDLLLWVSIGYYFVFSMGSAFNIGVRHLLPVYPLLSIAVAGSLREAGRRLGVTRWSWSLPLVVGLMSVTQIATAISAHPFELSYFNAFGGGMANGYRRLSDSNVDWGLDLRRLAAVLQKERISNPTVCYFGGDLVSARIGVPDFASQPWSHGNHVAISTALLEIGPAFYALNGRPDLARRLSLLIGLLRERGELVGRIGGSTLLYRLPGGAALPGPPSVSAPNSDILRR
jgi:hypothetical protein